jgi:hypothetical protein
MSSGCMQGESAPLIYWVPIALAGIGLNLWILGYLLVKWPGSYRAISPAARVRVQHDKCGSPSGSIIQHPERDV